MDPYLESRWSDIHVSLICFISEALQALLPADLRARCDEIHLLDEIERWIQIINIRDDNNIVTVIEVVRPRNKQAGMFRSAYERRITKRRNAGISVVEIDLIRGDDGPLKLERTTIPEQTRGLYVVVVKTGRQSACYPIKLNQRLPTFRVPLGKGDADLALPLQPMIEKAYAAGGHDDIDYCKPLDPPLSVEDEAWADQLLRTAGRRR